MFFSADQHCLMADQLWLSESELFRTEKLSAVLEKINSESPLLSANILNSVTLGFRRWLAVIPRWFTLNQFWYLHLSMGISKCDNVVRSDENAWSGHWTGIPSGLSSQRHSALISADSETIPFWLSVVHYLKSLEQRWFSTNSGWQFPVQSLVFFSNF